MTIRQQLITDLSREVRVLDRQRKRTKPLIECWKLIVEEMLDNKSRHFGSTYDALGYEDNRAKRVKFWSDLCKAILGAA